MALLGLVFCDSQPADNPARVWAFYYPSYGDLKTDNWYRYWDLTPGGSMNESPGEDDFVSNYYPKDGCYSVNDTNVIIRQMRQLINARVDGIILSWWGAGSFEDVAALQIMNYADKFGLKVCFQIEDIPERSGTLTRIVIKYILSNYGSHPAFYRDSRFNNRPLFLINDAQKINTAQWTAILDPKGSNTIRGTDLDAVVLAVWLDQNDGPRIVASHFDGFYNFYVSEGISYGSIPDNWSKLSDWADKNEKFFIPCVGPNFNDRKNGQQKTHEIRSRDEASQYDKYWQLAIDQKPLMIAVNSFNNWNAGNQIEPTIFKAMENSPPSDSSLFPSDYYLSRTALWSEIYTNSGKTASVGR